ncbi:MAG: site-2 protease family protein [Victivallales bacterium]|nr:site-2 protease family protein [Victivallales bacterium]
MIWFLDVFKRSPEEAVLKILIVVFSICCHEYMHARTALWQGDDTAARAGHLTLNPLKQMGTVSIIMLFMFGIAFGQVPVNPSRMRKPWGEALVSFAGPFANFALFLLFTAGAVIVAHTAGDYSPVTGRFMMPERQYFLYSILLYGSLLNFVLFIFNMAPVPPLDGYGVLCSFFPNLKRMSSEFLKGATLFIFIALFASAQYLFIAGAYVIALLLQLTNGFAGVAA